MFKQLFVATSIFLGSFTYSQSIFQTEKETTNLQANANDSVRTITKKGFINGLLDLESIVKNNEFEEVWVFKPSETTWYEIGHNASGWKDGGNTVCNDNTFVYNNINKEEYFVYGHFHPLKNSSNLVEIQNLKNENEKIKQLNEMYVTYAIPNNLDNETAFEYAIFQSEENKGKSISFVGTPLGVLFLRISPEGYDNLKNYVPTKNGGSNLSMKATELQLNAEINLNGVIHNENKSYENEYIAEKRIKRMLDLSSDKEFKFEFYTYDELKYLKEKKFDLIKESYDGVFW